jgi:pimeloyl-ACP methyl ester carboxylesterase
VKQIRIILPLVVLIFTVGAVRQGAKSAAAAGVPKAQQPPAARVVDLNAGDGTILKASYFAAAKPGPGVLLLHQINRTRKGWDELAGQLAAAGINTLTLDMRGFGESGTPYTKLTDAEKAKVSPMWPSDVETAFQYLVSSRVSSATLSAWEEPGGSASSIPSK